ncbi:MAG: hypothetical protein HY811_00635 [Planctomycetes bacterium]|nr:hypothetical protein [Planctomycetota bacterium]
MPKKDYMPDPDGDFNIWQGNFVMKVVGAPAAYGLTPADVVNVSADSAAWQMALAAHVAAQNAAKAAAETKDDTRDILESEIRSLVKRIQSYPAMTDAQREDLGITVPDLTRTPLSEQIVLSEPPPIIEAKCTGPKTVRFLALDTNSPYIHNVGNVTTVTLAYKAQWFDRRKRMGPFGNPVVVAVTP